MYLVSKAARVSTKARDFDWVVDLIEWRTEDDRLVARRGDFTIAVWHEAPHYKLRIEYQGSMIAEGGSLRTGDAGRRAAQRAGVKMAAFHGMELPHRLKDKVAPFLVDPHSTKKKTSRRVVDRNIVAVPSTWPLPPVVLPKK